MSRSSAATIWDAAASAWADHAIPWLMSASMHFAVLDLLGLFAAQGALRNSGAGSGHNLTGTVFSFAGDDETITTTSVDRRFAGR